METLSTIITDAQAIFRQRLLEVEENGGLTKDIYVRYLTMQYHLTKGVQRYFLLAASHPNIIKNNRLRKFLYQFSWEEWPHFTIAAKDIQNSGAEIGQMPFEVALWHAYFQSVIDERPFLRLGAACILENISHGAGDVINRMFAQADYLRKDNLVFFTIHRHGAELPHGDQIVEALSNVTGQDYDDLCLGALQGLTMYMRMVESVVTGVDMLVPTPSTVHIA